MRHALVAESQRQGELVIKDLLKNGYITGILGQNNRTLVVRTISGRIDEIVIITYDNHASGHRFDGRILRASSSSTIDDLFMYIRRSTFNRTRIIQDAETLRWDWASQDAYSDFAPPDRSVATAIRKELEAQVGSRKRR